MEGTIYRVAVWWPKDGGYGGAVNYLREEEARQYAASLERCNYKRENIHIHKITTERLEY